jgi:hypothetical protein
MLRRLVNYTCLVSVCSLGKQTVLIHEGSTHDPFESQAVFTDPHRINGEHSLAFMTQSTKLM